MRYALGIDLGTTNSVVAFAPLGSDPPAVPTLLPLPQVVTPSVVEPRPLLPSYLYIGTAEEAAAGTLDLPWARQREWVVGSFARRQAADVPDAHGGGGEILARLPAGGPAPADPAMGRAGRGREDLTGRGVAPVTSSTWWPPGRRRCRTRHWRSSRLCLTVPASFDASARDLTREAALGAGLPAELMLLEEPQAALYAWLADAGERWRRRTDGRGRNSSSAMSAAARPTSP